MLVNFGVKIQIETFLDDFSKNIKSFSHFFAFSRVFCEFYQELTVLFWRENSNEGHFDDFSKHFQKFLF